MEELKQKDVIINSLTDKISELRFCLNSELKSFKAFSQFTNDQLKKRSSHKAVLELLTTLGKKRFTRKEYIAVSVALGVKEKTASNRLDDNLKAKRPSIKRIVRGKFRIITQAEYTKFITNLK